MTVMSEMREYLSYLHKSLPCLLDPSVTTNSHCRILQNFTINAAPNKISRIGWLIQWNLLHHRRDVSACKFMYSIFALFKEIWIFYLQSCHVHRIAYTPFWIQIQCLRQTINKEGDLLQLSKRLSSHTSF